MTSSKIKKCFDFKACVTSWWKKSLLQGKEEASSFPTPQQRHRSPVMWMKQAWCSDDRDSQLFLDFSLVWEGTFEAAMFSKDMLCHEQGEEFSVYPGITMAWHGLNSAQQLLVWGQPINSGAKYLISWSNCCRLVSFLKLPSCQNMWFIF